MELTVLVWNLFHGRDHPPDPRLRTWRSRLLKVTEHNDTYAQVNQPLLDEFAAVIAGAEWSVCMLQECPPPWAEPLAQASGAGAHRVLTSRNQLATLRRAPGRPSSLNQLAPLRRAPPHGNPYLPHSGERASNLILARRPWRTLERRA